MEDLIDDFKSNKNENTASDYETLLQKEDTAIRQYISYEHLEVVELENKLLIYQIVSKNKYIIFSFIFYYINNIG